MTIDPRQEEPPHGDMPYFAFGNGLAKMDRDANHAWAKIVIGIILVFAFVVVVLVAHFFLALPNEAHARDDGRHTSDPLKPWFDQLASGKGLCCSFADGFSIADVDWDVREGRYRVHLEGRWIDVPDVAVVAEPNRYGPAVVWPYQDTDGFLQIRCFLPGAGS
jgi:hypothetical protein